MQIIPFEYQGTPLRVVQMRGEAWILMPDLCRAVGHTNPTKAQKSIDEDDLTKVKVIDGLGRMQEVNACNQSGLYQFLLRSKLPASKPFRRWVTREVLPAVMQHGHYTAPGATAPGPSLADLAQLVGLRTGQIESQVQEMARQVERVPEQAAQAAMGALAALSAKKKELKSAVERVVQVARKAPEHDRQARGLANYSRVWRDCHGAAWPPVSSLADYTSPQQIEQAITRASALLQLLGAAPLPRQQQFDLEVMPPDAR